MDGTRFRLYLNLQNLSMISIAAKLWDSQDIKNRIKNNFSGLDCKFPDENWCEMSKFVVQSANSVYLPPRLSVLLKKTVLLIGQKIYDWILYVTKILKLDVISTQKIYFRVGSVDEIKIFDLYWRDLMARDDFMYQSDCFRHSSLFFLACMFGRERFVEERKNEILDEFSVFCPEIKEGDEIYNIMSVSIWMTAGKSKLRNVCSPREMFEVCLEAGFSEAAKFYWQKLDEVDKFSNLAYFAKKCWQQYNDGFVLEKHCENLLFLINQMGEEEKSLFFAEYADQIIRMFLPVWPYRELIVNLLKYDWIVESSRLLKMAEMLMWFSLSLNRSEFPLDNELVFQIMQKVWGNLPVDKKLCFLKDNRGNVCIFFLTLHPELLNLLFNDPSITEVGEKMDSFIIDGFLRLVKRGKYDFLNSLIETVFNFIPEPKESLKENFLGEYFVQDLIEKDESFGLVDQFLDWSTESEAERCRLKNKIDTISIWRSFTDWDYKGAKFELADKFLKWRLETDTEIKRFKEEMKSYNFVILGHSGYVRIKSGDLSWLRPGDSLAMHPDDEYAFHNADGLTFSKFEDATELNRGVVLGIKSFCPGVEHDFLGPGGCHATRYGVNCVGTKVGDFIVFIVRETWNNQDSGSYDFNLDEVVYLSNALIKFYYYTDEEVLEFRKTKLSVLVTENLMEFLLGALKNYRPFPENFLGDFCKFCMIPSGKIEEIKIKQRSDIEKVLDTYLIDQNHFDFADIYLNWLFGEVKKTEVLKKFLNSSNKGALLCVSFLKKWNRKIDWGDFSQGVFLDWGDIHGVFLGSKICKWLSLIDDTEKLKSDVLTLYGNSLPEWFSAVLDGTTHSDVNTAG